MKYRKKPVIIEAYQMRRVDFMDVIDLPVWLLEAWNGVRDSAGTIQRARESNDMEIVTLEGNHRVTEGDWIIRGVKGELYPCKPDIFEMTYEEVPE